MIRIYQYGEVSNDEIFARPNADVDVSGTVSEIIANVRENGDRALYEYCERFDRVTLDCLEVTRDEIDAAFSAVDEEFIDVMRRAKENIHDFHSRQVRNSFVLVNSNHSNTFMLALREPRSSVHRWP